VLQPIRNYDIDVGLDFGRQPAAIFGQGINSACWSCRAARPERGRGDVCAEGARFIAQRFPDHPLSRFRFWGDPKGQDKTQTDDRTAYEVFEANGMKVRAFRPA
jgi:hypothetical protein